MNIKYILKRLLYAVPAILLVIVMAHHLQRSVEPLLDDRWNP